MALRFHLAGINNQNFLMRDEQTGTYWQQITGLAVAGPMAGRRLELVPADELTFTLWRGEHPHGTVLNDVAAFTDDYAKKNWDERMARVPTVISYAQAGLHARELMLGVHAFGVSRAYLYDTVLREKLIEDHIGSQPVLVVVGPDNRSVRVFENRMPDRQFYRLPNGTLLDAATGSEWNFAGCAVSGKSKGTCLTPVNVIKDYWFDWRNYNSGTTVFGVRERIR